MKIYALCNSHSRLSLMQLNSQTEAELSCFSVALFMTTWKISCSTRKEKASHGLKTSALCMDERHNIHVIAYYVLPPNLVTQQFSLEVVLSPLTAMSPFSQASPWQHPAHPFSKKGSQQGSWTPSSPDSYLPPLTQHKLKGDPCWMFLSGLQRKKNFNFKSFTLV